MFGLTIAAASLILVESNGESIGMEYYKKTNTKVSSVIMYLSERLITFTSTSAIIAFSRSPCFSLRDYPTYPKERVLTLAK